MKKNFLIFIILFLLSGKSLFSQKKEIQLKSIDSTENSFLKNYKLDKDTEFSNKELREKLQLEGYIYNSIDSVVKTPSRDSITYYITLRSRIDSLHLKLPKKYNYLKKEIPLLNHNIIKTNFTNFKNIVSKINDHFIKEGKAFSSVTLSDIQLNKNKIRANILIQESQVRTVDEIIIKGYNDFPKSFLNHYVKIKKGDVFNRNKINLSSEDINNLNFAKTTKPPEGLFKKDSTLVYFYIDKTQRNNFDGLLNFSTNPSNENLLITGNLNLELINLLNTGEELKFSWNANGNESQNINLSTRIPYIFNSPISNLSSFEIHKQDSTFLSSKFKTSFLYNLSPRTEIGITYETEASTNNLENIISNIDNYDNSFFGINLSFKKPKLHSIYRIKYSVLGSYQIGKRTITSIKNNQHRVNFEASYLFDINQRNSIFIRNKSELLFSNNYLINELYRIGGTNSIRGFNPQSIFTSKYSIFNLEYRIQTNSDSYIYSISDFGFTESINETLEKLVSLGLGYSFIIKKSKIDLIFSGNLNNTPNNNKGFNLSLSFKNYF
ncbi:POTRA domain-containing protein [Tenacibaculum sp. MEBiC06402]|uniref:POTRA domain-containing protein n=1 Tax=unclassified Tenacibaculum TaxID=2635139 RepID=UPI003B9AABA9